MMSRPVGLPNQTFGNSIAANGGFTFQGSVAGGVDFNIVGHSPINPLDDLPKAAFNAQAKEHFPSCLKNTRQSLLEEIEQWADGRGGKNMYWLKGMAGTGKSTVAITIARRYDEKGRLGASFFFSRGEGDLASTQKFAMTIAAQLARNLPGLKNHVNKAVEEDPRIREIGLSEQWRRLILKPLSQLGERTSSQPIVLVVDALDECDNEKDASRLIQCLASAAAVKNIRLRILITSRPDQQINYGFSLIPEDTHEDFVLHDIADSVVGQDLAVFYKHELTHIARRFSLDDSFYSDASIQTLVRKSGCLFIHAATVCRFIEAEGILAKSFLIDQTNVEYQSTHPEKELYKMYNVILEYSFARYSTGTKAAEIHSLFNRVVGSIVLLYDTVTPTELATLLAIQEGDIRPMLHCLHSVLDVSDNRNKRIRLVHPSFRDYLLDPSRSSNKDFSIDAAIIHRNLVFCCLRLMKQNLRRNMCNIEEPGTRAVGILKSRIDELIAHPVQYACHYWIYHLEQSGLDPTKVVEINEFFRNHYLHWLESLAWTRQLSDGMSMIRQLEARLAQLPADSSQSTAKSTWLQIVLCDSPGIPSSLHQTVYDAMRFFVSNNSIIEEAPLQTYCSAILFAPENSMIRKMYIDELPRWIVQRPITYNYWGAHLQTLAVSELIGATGISSDGRLIARLVDKTLQIVDTTTGREISRLQEEISDWSIFSLSADGRLAVTGCLHEIQLWDVATGKKLRELSIDVDIIIAIAISLDGRLTAFVDPQDTVWLWDMATGKDKHRLVGHSDAVLSIAFSPKSQFMATASRDKTVRLWDVDTGQERSTLVGHSNEVISVAISPDSRLVASASWDGMILVWDVATGTEQRNLRIPAKDLGTVTFLPSGQLRAYELFDSTLRLWDVPLQSEPRHLWNMAMCQQHNTDIAYLGRVRCVAFSPDGRLAASAKDKGAESSTVWIWDVIEGTKKRTLQWPFIVYLLALSPDCQRIALSSMGFYIWDAATDKTRRLLTHVNHSRGVVTFSPDGRLAALAGTTLQFWNCDTEKEEGTQYFCENVWASAFSSNSQRIALDQDGDLRVIDIITREEQFIPQSVGKSLVAIAFSPDGQLIASMSMDNMLRVWNMSTSKIQHKLRIDNWIKHLAFSSCGKYLVTERGKIPISSAEPRRAGNLFVSGNWIQEDGVDIIRIHPDYLENFAFTSGNIVAFHLQEPCVLRVDTFAPKSMIHEEADL